MKKIMFLVMGIVALTITSCTTKSTTADDTVVVVNDSIVVDSLGQVVDSLSVDSVVVAE